MIYSLRSGRCWRHRMAGSLRCPLHSGNAVGFMKREGAVRVPVSRSGCTDTGKCSIRHLSRASDRRCRYCADGPVPLGASILKETPTFPLGAATTRTIRCNRRLHFVPKRHSCDSLTQANKARRVHSTRPPAENTAEKQRVRQQMLARNWHDDAISPELGSAKNLILIAGLFDLS